MPKFVYGPSEKVEKEIVSTEPKKKKLSREEQVTKAADEYREKMFSAKSKGRKHLSSFMGMARDRFRKLTD